MCSVMFGFVCQIGLHMRNFAHVTNYLTKLEQVAITQTDSMYDAEIGSRLWHTVSFG